MGIGTIIDFQEKLTEWRKDNDTPKGKVKLEEIFKYFRLPKMSKLSRKQLLDTIIDYFIKKRIPLTLTERDDMARQIVKMFPKESLVSKQLLSDLNSVSRPFDF